MASTFRQSQNTSAGPSGVRIRNARRGDGEALAGLLKELGFDAAADVQTVNWVMSHPEIEIFVAVETGDRPVAMAAFSHRPQLRLRGRVATLDEFVVSEAYRRRGIGRALLERLVERTKSLSVKRLELHSTLARGEDVTPFFEACGFARVDGQVFRLTGFDG